MDKFTAQRIQTLHPKVIPAFAAFINAVEKELNIVLRITSATRTFAQQADLYGQGRTRKGAIVTNALPGQSYHNYGLAIDACQVNADGGVSFGLAVYNSIAPIAKRFGIEWGGLWTGNLRDEDHYQISFGLGVNELIAMHKAEVAAGKITDAAGFITLPQDKVDNYYKQYKIA